MFSLLLLDYYKGMAGGQFNPSLTETEILHYNGRALFFRSVKSDLSNAIMDFLDWGGHQRRAPYLGGVSTTKTPKPDLYL